jgi:tRNA(adenine34) deaminase
VLWSSLDPIWQAVIAEGWAAYAAGSHAIGAVITSPDGAIVARGRNRGRDGTATPGQLHASRLAHAEINAILALPPELDPRTVTMWATTEPCPLCIGAVAIAKIGHLRFACRDPYAGSAGLATANAFMRSRAVQVRGPELAADVEAVLTVMEVEFALRAGWAHDAYLAAMVAVFPGAVQAAGAAHATGWLWRLASSGTPVGEAMDAIASDRLIAQGA